VFLCLSFLYQLTTVSKCVLSEFIVAFVVFCVFRLPYGLINYDDDFYYFQANVLDTLKAAQEKYGDVEGLQETSDLVERLYKDHDELSGECLGDLSDSDSEAENDDDDDDFDINLEEISDDSGRQLSLRYAIT